MVVHVLVIVTAVSLQLLLSSALSSAVRAGCSAFQELHRARPCTMRQLQKNAIYLARLKLEAGLCHERDTAMVRVKLRAANS